MSNDFKLNRRNLLLGTLGLGGVAATSSIFLGGLWSDKMQPEAKAREGAFEIIKSDTEWRKLLTSDQFSVLRREATEKPYSSPHLKEKRDGVFQCAACDLDLYAAQDKYDSHTGWPSFTRPVSDDAIGTRIDRKLLFARTEVHCRRCGGHLGHIFDDGPAPLGKRHCINGVALTFKVA